MPAYYRAIQYVPDPVAGERINVGIAAYFEGLVRTRFLVNWQRVKALAGKDATNLRRVESLFAGIDETHLREMINNARNSIQFAPECSTIRSLDEAVDEGARRFLVEPPSPSEVSRTHSAVVGAAKLKLLSAIASCRDEATAKSLVRLNMQVPGRFGIDRRFDLGVRNGKPLHVVQAVSFKAVKSPERQVEAAAFLAEEVKGKLPLTVVVAPPSDSSFAYENARKTFAALGASVVTEEEFAETANSIATAAMEHIP